VPYWKKVFIASLILALGAHGTEGMRVCHSTNKVCITIITKYALRKAPTHKSQKLSAHPSVVTAIAVCRILKALIEAAPLLSNIFCLTNTLTA
jgi:succinate dehydrogenase/fumarate reductase cytochrome b subunit